MIDIDKVREQWAEIICEACFPYICANWELPPNKRIEKCKQLSKWLDQILNLTVVEGEECPECGGKKFVGKCAKSMTGSPNFGYRLVPCSKCNGTGKLSGKTLKQVLEEL